MSAATASPRHHINAPFPRKRKSLQNNVAPFCPVESPKLPLKKRFYAEENYSDPPSPEKPAEDRLVPEIRIDSDPKSSEETVENVAASSSEQPVDFSLPNRIRAKTTPAKSDTKSELGELHSPSDTTAASDSPCASDKTDDSKAADGSRALFGTNGVTAVEQAPVATSAFTSHLWSQHMILEALRLSGRLNSGIPVYPPAVGCLPFPPLAASTSLGSLSGKFSNSSGGTGLFPSTGSIFQTGADLNLLSSISLAASSGSRQWQGAEKHSKDNRSSSTENLLDPEERNSSVSPGGTFVINPATGNKVRRNYKNMTRERRVEANARERTRVHTIGSAFDNIRKLIPCLAPDQKLSKLSILRIACRYIMLLAAMNGLDYSPDNRGYTVEECIDMLNETMIAESKAKRNDR